MKVQTASPLSFYLAIHSHSRGKKFNRQRSSIVPKSKKAKVKDTERKKKKKPTAVKLASFLILSLFLKQFTGILNLEDPDESRFTPYHFSEFFPIPKNGGRIGISPRQ